MSNNYGPKIVTDGLVFYIDAAYKKSISAIGCEGFTNAPQLIKNILSPSDVITVNGNVRVGNLTFYTLYALQYSESTRTPANRDGITVGYNDIVSPKLYEATRDMNYYVYDNSTNTWVPDSYFNGWNTNGHSYDTYADYTNEHLQFRTDYGIIVSAFPNATHIIIGSHAAENNDNDAATLAILQDLGLPDDHIGTTRPEYILVGKPGLGKGNAYVYVRENNSSTVAHANIGLPLGGNSSNYLEFNGIDDYLTIDQTDVINLTPNSAHTIEYWVNLNTLPSGTYYTPIMKRSFGYSYGHLIPSGGSSLLIYKDDDTSPEANVTYQFQTNTWYHIVDTYDGNTVNIYINGILVDTISPITFTTNSFPLYIGSNGGTNYYLHGKIAKTMLYNKELTSTEVLQNYNATKGRFGL